MIVIDTNVISELWKAEPALQVVAWVDAPFDLNASRAYAELMAGAKGAGNAIGQADGYIAASAAARSYTVATRDTGPFETAGMAGINPLEA